MFYVGVYAQDDWRVRNNLKFNLGLRFDVPIFGDTGLHECRRRRADVPRRDRQPACSTRPGNLPDANILWSPRFGFNWDVNGNLTTQVRGGTGVFTGRPAYVWISNQIGNTGVLTGFDAARQHHRAAVPPGSGSLQADQRHRRSGGELRAGADRRRLQVPAGVAKQHRGRSAARRGLDGHGGFLYNRDVNGIYYINANLPAAAVELHRRRHPAALDQQSINPRPDKCQPQRAEHHRAEEPERGHLLEPRVLGRTAADGRSLAQDRVQLRRVEEHGRSGLASRSARGTTISTRAIRTILASDTRAARPGHRVLRRPPPTRGVLQIRRDDGVGLLGEPHDRQRQLHVFSGDLNGDGGTSNDLIYIPRDISEMNFQTYRGAAA